MQKFFVVTVKSAQSIVYNLQCAFQGLAALRPDVHSLNIGLKVRQRIEIIQAGRAGFI